MSLAHRLLLVRQEVLAIHKEFFMSIQLITAPKSIAMFVAIMLLSLTAQPSYAEDPWVDTGTKAVLFKFNDNALNFGIDHIQKTLDREYSDLMTVDASNPLTVNEILYGNETYQDIFQLNLGDDETADEAALTGPLYFKCPAINKWCADFKRPITARFCCMMSTQ